MPDKHKKSKSRIEDFIDMMKKKREEAKEKSPIVNSILNSLVHFKEKGLIATYVNARREAFDPDTSPERLNQLADSKIISIRRLVATNPSTSGETLRKMYQDERNDLDFYFRTHVYYAHPNCPLEDMEHMAYGGTYKDTPFLESLALNTSAPFKILDCLYKEKNYGLKSIEKTAYESIRTKAISDIYEKPELDDKTLWSYLEESYTPPVRLAVALHPNVSMGTFLYAVENATEQMMDTIEKYSPLAEYAKSYNRIVEMEENERGCELTKKRTF